MVYVAMMFATIFWGFSFIWTKQVLTFYGPITTVFLRLLLSATLLFLLGSLAKKIERVSLNDLGAIALMAFFEPFLYFIGETIALMHVSSTVASVVISTIPLFSPIAAYYFFGEKLSKMNFFGILISIFGVYLVISKAGFSPNISVKGISLLMFAVFSAVAYSVVVVKLSHKYNVYTLIAWQNLLGMFMFLPVFLVFEFKHFSTVPVSFEKLSPLFMLAIFASSIGFMLFTYGIKHLGIIKANTIANIIPVFTALFAWMLLGETLNTINMAGILVVIAGLLLSQIKTQKVKTYLANRKIKQDAAEIEV